MTEQEAIAAAQGYARWRGCDFGTQAIAHRIDGDFPSVSEDFRRQFMGGWYVSLEPPEPCLGGKWFFAVNQAGKVVWTNAPPLWMCLIALPFSFFFRKRPA